MKIKIDESEHFFTCDLCGKPVDMRDLSQVFEHEHANLIKIGKLEGRRIIKLDNAN